MGIEDISKKIKAKLAFPKARYTPQHFDCRRKFYIRCSLIPSFNITAFELLLVIIVGGVITSISIWNYRN